MRTQYLTGLLSAACVMAVAGGAQAACRDPWVTQAVQQVTGHAANGAGETGDCSILNYGGGHWSSYPDLVTKVQAHFGRGPALAPAAIAKPSAVPPPSILAARPAAPLIGGNGIVAQGGGNIVAQGGGNIRSANGIVAQGGGNVRSANGIVAQGGGN